MKTALITTTINVPLVLELYRAIALPSTKMFVAGDEKTPSHILAPDDFDFAYYPPERQKALGYKCSELLGWNTIARRNIALLEALKWGADIIVSIDDDNIPINRYYFRHFHDAFQLFNGISVSGLNGWFDPGVLTGVDPNRVTTQRGFPHEQRGPWQVSHVVNGTVGVAQGLILGDPDTSAVERIANLPTTEHVTELARAGVVLAGDNWAPINTQNVAFVRDLAPCFLMLPQLQRYDDIFAGLVAQRVMRETGHLVHLGQPFVWQQRNSHKLDKDLEQELWGMLHIEHVADFLEDTSLPKDAPVLDLVAKIYERFPAEVFGLDDSVNRLAAAWFEDVGSVL